MSKNRFFATILAAFLLAAATGFAHDEKHVMKLKVDSDGEAIEIDDLEIGETRQFFTDSGKEIVVTREKQGYELSIDGREIDVFSPGDHHGVSVVTVDREGGDGKVDVRVKKVLGAHGKVLGAHGSENVFIYSGDEGEGEHEGHGSFVWNIEKGEGEAHSFSMSMDMKSVADRVLESGVLDRLDEATRQEILDEIEEAERHRVIHTDTKAIVIDTEDEQ